MNIHLLKMKPMYKYIFAFLSSFLIFFSVQAQGHKLKPGFDKSEFTELLKISSRQLDTTRSRGIPEPERFEMTYRSPVVGLDNRWDMWQSADSVAVISIRGTTRKTISWVENFYGAMVPAAGTLHLSEDFSFDYHLADNPQAAVHTGWLIGAAYISEDVVQKMQASYQAGVRDFVITGHSQGGAIAYLLTSHLRHLIKKGLLPDDIQIKTYCSAAPKPGNLYYAYEYENQTSAGWAYNVVNTADWVPETPVTIQTLDDFNETNPFTNAKAVIKKQKFPQRLMLGFVHGQLDKPTRKAQKRYQKYLGKVASKYAKNHLKGYLEPEYYKSSHYTRAGNQIILLADNGYYEKYPENINNPFVHHMLGPYLYLLNKLP